LAVRKSERNYLNISRWDMKRCLIVYSSASGKFGISALKVPFPVEWFWFKVAHSISPTILFLDCTYILYRHLIFSSELKCMMGQVYKFILSFSEVASLLAKGNSRWSFCLCRLDMLWDFSMSWVPTFSM
jgi:hypothetical protein